jgi:uncharacterized protein YndB with AHSA1/START domain
MRIEQKFHVRRSPGDVFAYLSDPANLRQWQPSKLAVVPLSTGPRRVGYRVKETTKVGPRVWDQVVEFSEFQPGRVFATHIVEGPVQVDGRWTFATDGAGGTEVSFVAEGRIGLPARLIEPLMRLGMERAFRKYHHLLVDRIESLPPGL